MFKQAATYNNRTDIEEYTDTVTSYITKCIDDVTHTKDIITRANWKPWLTEDVLRLLRARDKAYRAGDEAGMKTARANLSRGIKEAKKEYTHKITTHFKDSRNAQSLWQGIQALTDYKPAPQSCESNISLLNNLNRFFARFEAQNSTCPQKTHPPLHEQPLCLSADSVKRTLAAINTRKATGPDNIPGRALKDCAGELKDVFTDIFNTSLKQAIVPSCFKAATIIPVPKKTAPSCFSDYRPVALTPIIMKCFERLVMSHIKAILPPTLDPFQFAYRAKRSIEDAICSALHPALTHLEKRDSYVRLLFIDFSSAFNTIIPQQLICKLDKLGLSTYLCNWLLDFLCQRPQVVRVGNNTSSSITLSTGAPRLRAQSAALHPADDDCTATYSNNHNLLTTQLWWVSSPRATRLNTGEQHQIPGVHISEDLSWTTNTASLAKRAQRRLYFLRKLRRASAPPAIMTTFYRGTIESILSSCIAVWGGSCTEYNRKALQRIVNTAGRIIGASLSSLKDIYTTHLTGKATKIVSDASHPAHNLFDLLPSGKSDRCGDLQADFMLNTSVNKADNSSCVTCRNPVQVPVGNVKVNQTELFHNGQVNADKANTLMENLKSTLDKLGNMSSAKVEAGEVKGAIIRLKEHNPVTVAFSVEAKTMVIVSNPNALQTKHSWSVDIPAEAVNISRSANGGEGFAGVLRFPNMSMDCKNSRVLDNAVYGMSMSANISNLKDPIKIHFENVSMENVTFICTSWNGVGDQPTWTEDGCETVKGNSTITCKCYHLTFFAILMNALPTNDTLSKSDLVSLTYISYIGCGLSIFFLGVALFTHFLLRKAKSSQAIQILMNLFTALLLLNLTFLTNESVANMGSNIGCIIIATLMHYSMLSTFTWFAMQALHLYLRLVKMSNTKDIKNYMLKMCMPAWACPAVVVITLAVLNKYTLVTITTTSGFQTKTCWIKDTTVHFVVNIGYYALVFLFTLGIFFVVVQKILMSSKLKVKDAKTPSVSKNIMAIMSLLALLGLTWGVAFFSYGPMMIPSYYIFCVLNAFQGFFLFIYYYNNSKDLAEDTKPDNPTFSSSTSSNIATSNTYVTQG
ncbi:hypothetical protein AALO_G00250850 [Alosa alosa]|uniref:Uncharacterized protein n=2 Tax=Alosa alosa TaxID=278164 RepID=A0AAV6FYK1_9TELE|nr:hypothetical protein AALO_G00250850 [Alosa alosa]